MGQIFGTMRSVGKWQMSSLWEKKEKDFPLPGLEILSCRFFLIFYRSNGGNSFEFKRG
jgi:hypothetical protein